MRLSVLPHSWAPAEYTWSDLALVGWRLSAYYCRVGMARGRPAGDPVCPPFSCSLVKGDVFLMSLSQGVWPFRQTNKHQQEMLTRGLGKNKATLSDSPNKGDLRGLKLAANEHISSFVLSCLARTATVEDARNFCAEFTQEEAFLVSVPVLTFILFLCWG